MLQIIQNNLQYCPKTLPNLIWNKISNGIELDDKELEYIKKCRIKSIINFGLIKNGCWIIKSFGAIYWYKYGKLHREDGPAVEFPDGYKEYWLNGLTHRDNGPAIEWPDGRKKYYINGQFIRCYK